MLLEMAIAYATQCTAKTPYSIRASADYMGRLIKLQLLYFSEERKERSGIALALDPGHLGEINERIIELGVDQLVRHIKEREQNATD
jgi:hypothetical protein